MAHHDSGRQVASALLTAAALGLAYGLSGSFTRVLSFVSALALFVAPGFPIARRFFQGPERMLAGAALGYLASSILASVLYAVGQFSTAVVFSSCAALAVLLAVLLRSRESEGTESWNPGFALCLIALALVAVPFLKVGVTTEGGVAYRSYFSADLMTHLSVVAELQKLSFTPADPFYAGGALGYYWLFFLFPALSGIPVGNQLALLLTYVAGDLLFVGLAYCCARRFAVRPAAAFTAVAAALVASSYEGVALLASGVDFRQQNVDAFSRWGLELTSIDGLFRSLLYTPQHLFSYSLLLVLILLIRERNPLGKRAILAGALLGGMAGMSIVTAMLGGPWACVLRLARNPNRRQAIVECFAMAAVSAVFLLWFVYLGFFSEAGGALRLRMPSLLEIPALALLEVGPLLLLSLPALRRSEARPLAVLSLLAMLAIFFLDVEGGNGVWMAWRAGSLLFVSLMLLAAAGVGAFRPALTALILAPAALTTALDLYNAQDVTNREESAGGFPWTVVVSRDDWSALSWLRAATTEESVVQWDARVRGPGEWALVPALAERRMAYGYPIFLLNTHKYAARGRRLRPLFNSEDPSLAHRLARDAGIRFIYIGAAERREPQNHCEKFFEAPELFSVAYANGTVTIFEVVD